MPIWRTMSPFWTASRSGTTGYNVSPPLPLEGGGDGKKKRNEKGGKKNAEMSHHAHFRSRARQGRGRNALRIRERGIQAADS